jgi:multisubunit Na+/H+ antiporter MnhF subunit
MMVAFAAALAVLIGAALAALRLLVGPTLQDRALAVNAICAKMALACAAAAILTGQHDAIAVAFALLLAGYVINLAVLKFFRQGAWQAPMARPE